jgi:hypothetical protein
VVETGGRDRRLREGSRGKHRQKRERRGGRKRERERLKITHRKQTEK